MAMVDADWSIDRATGNIRYEGVDHTAAGTPTYATVIQFHRWLQAFADDEAFSNDDELDIIDKNPSNRSTDNIITLVNGFNIDAEAAEHLYDGTIIQGSGSTEERWDGIINFGNANAHIQIIQDGAIVADDFWNYGWEAGSHTGAADASVLTDSTLGASTDEWVGYTIKNITDGSQGLITANTATTITAELEGGTDDDWDNGDVFHIAKPLNGDAGQGISHRFLIKTRDKGVDIDRRRLIGTTRRFFNTYSEFKINGTAQGNNVLALADSNDLNNTTAIATVEGWTTITNTEGLRLLDISGDGSDEEYYSEWTRDTYTINQFYERLKWLTRDGSTSTQNGLNGEAFRGITHSYVYDGETGTQGTTNDVYCYGTNVVFTGGSGTAVLGEEIYEDTATPTWKGRIVGIDDNTGSGSIIVDVEVGGTVTDTETFSTTNGFAGTVSGTPTAQTSAGRIKLFAIDDDGSTGNMYGQVLSGVAPDDGTVLYHGDSTCDVGRYHVVNVTVTERTISTPFAGQSTGSALIGSYGLGMEPTDTAAADTFFDLSNTAITPPNTVTFTVSGLISGDRVLVTEDDGNDIKFNQMTSDGSLSATNVTAVSVVAIPSDTPLTGTIRIERDDGLYSRHAYSAFSTSTNDFTIGSTDFSTNQATTPFNVFISYVDKATSSTTEEFSYVYSSPRTHFVRVRDGGSSPIKTAETTGVMGTNGGSASVNRIADD